MSTLFLNREAIKVDIEPVSFEAHSYNPLGGKVGKLTLEFDREGFRVINKKGRTVSTVCAGVKLPTKRRPRVKKSGPITEQ